MCVCVDREQGEGLSKTGLVVICPAKWARLVIRIISRREYRYHNATFSIKQLKFLTHFHSLLTGLHPFSDILLLHTSLITRPSLSIPIDNSLHAYTVVFHEGRVRLLPTYV